MPLDDEKEQDFDAAFDAAMKDELTAEETAESEADEAAIAAAEPPAEPEPEVSAEPPAEPEPEALAEPPAEPEPEASAETPAEPDWKTKFEELQNQITELRKPAQPPAPEQLPAAEWAPPPVPTADTVLSAEERELLDAYESEWPDVSKAEALKRKVELAVLQDAIYKDVAAALESVLGNINPVLDIVSKTADDAHNAAVFKAHPDADKILNDVDAWADTQPAYLKAAMKSVLDGGSAEEVIDLFTRFKKETGRVAPQVPPPAPETSKPVDEKAVEALAPVKGGRKAAESSAVDPNDFQSAWKQAANS